MSFALQTRTTLEQTDPSRYRQVFWLIQGWGLCVVTLLSFFPRFFHYQEYLFVSLLIIVIGIGWYDRITLWTRTPIDLPLFLLVGWVLVTIPFSIEPLYSFSEWLKLAVQLLVFYWTLLILRVYQQDRVWIRRILLAVIIGTITMNGYVMIIYVLEGNYFLPGFNLANVPNSSSPLLATYAIISLPLIAASGVFAQGNWSRTLHFLAFGLGMTGLAYSGSRAGWLAITVQGVTFVIVSRLRKFIVPLLIICLLATGGLYILSQTGESGLIERLEERLGFLSIGAQEILAHPFVGIGYGNDILIRNFEHNPDIAEMGHLHNTFVMVTVGSGILGGIFLIWTLVKGTWVMFCRYRLVENKHDSALLIGTAIMIVGFTFRNNLDYMFSGSMAYLFWILVASGLSLGENIPLPASTSSRTANKEPA